MTSVRTLQRALIVVLLLSAAGLAALLLTAGRGAQGAPAGPRDGGSAFDGPVLPPGVRAGAFALSDQNGRRVTLGSLRGDVVVVTFIHSKCTETCPLTAETIKGALNLLAPATGRGVKVVAITAAPKEDTAASRRAFLAKHDLTGRMAYLNGPRRSLQAVWNAYHVLPEPPGASTDVHTTFTMLVDRQGILRVGFPDAQMTPEALAHDIGVLARQRA